MKLGKPLDLKLHLFDPKAQALLDRYVHRRLHCIFHTAAQLHESLGLDYESTVGESKDAIMSVMASVKCTAYDAMKRILRAMDKIDPQGGRMDPRLGENPARSLLFAACMDLMLQEDEIIRSGAVGRRL